MPTADTPGEALYRIGIAEAHRGEPKSLQTLGAALDACVAAEDRTGTMRAAGARLLIGHELGVYRRFPDYLALLAPLREERIGWEDRNDELVVLAGLVTGMIFYAPDDSALQPVVDRIVTLLEADLDVNLRFAAGRIVLYYAEPREKRALSQRIYSLLEPAMDAADLSPWRLAQFLIYWSRCASYAKEPGQAVQALARARELAQQHDLRQIRFTLAAVDIERSEPEGNLVQAERAVAALDALADPASLSDLLRLSFMKTRLARARGDGDAAVFHAARAAEYARELELPAPMQAVYVVSEAQARLAVDDLTGATAGLSRAIRMVPAAYVDEVRDMIDLIDAFAAVRNGAPDARPQLAAVWAEMRRRQFYDTFDGFPAFAIRMCVLALEQGIETDFVANLIRHRRFAPPPGAPEAWPWPLRIWVLGEFRIERDDQPLTFEGKAQKKPLEIVKALVALGGRGVGKQRLRDALWPDAEPAAAAAACDMAISRLRKLLAVPDAIWVEEGKVGFNDQSVWIDAFAFDRDVDLLQSILQRSADPAAVAAVTERLAARYRGAFLNNDEPQRWSLAARDRYRNRFLRSLGDAGRFHAECGQWPRAIALLERATEEDSLAEEIYRQLMRCHLARDEPAEAARVYRRCRDMLSIQLGIAPSAETEALFRSIYAA